MNYPKISIVTPSYNQGQYIEQCILSVINQNYPNLEYIIIDGGSTDNSVEIIKKYEKHITYWVSEKDNGIYDAMNKGTKKSNGEWIFFLGTDDTLFDNILNNLYVLLSNCDFIYGNVMRKPSNIVFGYEYSQVDILNQTICHQAVFVKRNLLIKHNYFNLKYKLCADYDFILKCFGDNHVKIKYTNQIISNYNSTGISANNNDFDFCIDKDIIIKENFNIVFDDKLFYEKVAALTLDFLERGELKKGLVGILKLIKKVPKKKLYWIKTAIYWVKFHF
jgi:glycosyltransferase involved in cell wall biosynthesis